MLFVHTMDGQMERAGFEMQFSSFRPLMSALNAPFTTVCKGMEKIDHMLCYDRNFFG